MKYLLITFFWVFKVTVLAAGDSITTLADEKTALECKLDLMLQARESLSLSYYAINEDEVGLKYAAAACLKAQQGLHVKIIIEKSRSKVTQNLIRLFKEYGIDIRYYNSYHAGKVYKNFSWLHDKLLVIDSSYVVLGGRNLNDKYYPSTEKRTELVDIETLIKGTPGAAAQRYIHHLLNSRFAYKTGRRKTDSIQYYHLKQILTGNMESFKNYPRRNWDSLLLPVNEAVFVNDNYRKWPKSKRIANTILYTLQHARHDIIAVSPYMIPPMRFMSALKEARKRGVNITLISNSPQVSDAKIIAAAYMNDRRKYLKRGIQVFEYNGEKMLHDKLFLVDDSIAIVGSYNFDNISYRMNSENIAKIRDSAFGAGLKAHIDSRIEDCFSVQKVRDRNPYNDVAVARRTRWNRILLRIFPFIRRFL